jgi:hypothetical protein
MKRTTLILILFCCFGPTVRGQIPTSPVVGPPARPGKVATYYDAAKDITNVVLGFSDVGGESPCGLYVSANSFYAGKTATQPSQVKLVIMRITPEDKIKSAPLRDLTFSVNGEVLNLGLMETASQQTNMDLRLETLESSLPFESFVKLVNAKIVEGKLGTAKFRLTDNNLSFMRAFASRFKS